MSALDEQANIHDIDCPDWTGQGKCVCKSGVAVEELARFRNRIAELEENAELFIKYIKNGENQKAHLQMLVLESCLTKSPEPPK